jgi:type I restriction enzyme S subunit
MPTFKKYRFSDCLSNIVDNRGRSCPVVSSGIPLIATNCIKNDQLYPVFENIRYVTQEVYNTWFRAHPKPGDMIFVCKGSPGRVCWVPDPINFCIAQDMLSIRANEEIVDTKFLFALLRSKQVQDDIGNLHVGSLIPHFKKGDFDQLWLIIPEDKTLQKRIGEIYFNFSLKIELNRQMNQTLEQMAQALFKKYFVDDIDADNLPGGWRWGRVGEVCEIKYGKDHKHLGDGKIPVYGSGGIMRYADKALFEKDSILIPRKGTLSNLFYVSKPFWSVDTMFYTIIKSQLLQKYLFYFLKTLDLASMNVGSAVPSLTTEVLNKIEIIIPHNSILEKFEKIISSFYLQMEVNNNQIHSLTQTRDTLLPKLMSGEIEVNTLIADEILS